MKAQMVSLALVLTVSAVTASVNADDKTGKGASQRFEAIKGLAGDWVEVDKDGKPTDKVVSSIRVTSGGNTVQETLFPGSDHEMVTMYHLDGEDLVLTHYCMLGNQPRMRAEPGTDVNRIVFKFSGATNLRSNDEQHMHQAALSIEGKDRYKAVWVFCKDGKACHEAKFDLVRKQR